jgi:hypothetical protein
MYSEMSGGKGTKLSLDEKKALVAHFLEHREMCNLRGHPQIEFMEPADVAAVVAEPDTVMGFIGDVVTKEAGHVHDGTFGSILSFFGLPVGSAEAAEVAHELCCECHGKFVSTIMAAGRVMNIAEPTA